MPYTPFDEYAHDFVTKHGAVNIKNLKSFFAKIVRRAVAQTIINVQ